MNLKIVRLKNVNSTSDYAKTLRLGGQDVVVWSQTQSGGRGTKGRSFSSREGGVYLSLLRFYQSFSANEAFKIMQTAAVAVCETLTAFGVRPQIKWPNDIYVNGKKMCGILIENTFSGGNVASSIVGIGINVYNSLEEELLPIATTLFLETGKRFTVDEVGETLIAKLFKENIYEKYGEYLGWIGEEVTLLSGEESVRATLLGVDELGNLNVAINGEKRRFAAAEITVRI